jgi:hypothetical protein
VRRTWIALECDDCGAQFPRSGAGITMPQDAAIYTWPILRAEARQTGWQRYGCKDYCPVCEKDHRNQAARDAAKKAGE